MKKAMVLAASLALLAGCGMFSHRESSSNPNNPNAPAATVSKSNASRSSASAPEQSKTVADAQKALKEAGFDPGGTDGVMGPRTEQALKDYQQSKGLKATGTLDNETRQALNVK